MKRTQTSNGLTEGSVVRFRVPYQGYKTGVVTEVLGASSWEWEVASVAPYAVDRSQCDGRVAVWTAYHCKYVDFRLHELRSGYDAKYL